MTNKEIASYDLAVIAKEKGFKDDTLAYYSSLEYPTDDSGENFNNCRCLYIEHGDLFNNNVHMLEINTDLAQYHWDEGTYDEGEHSRCTIIGDSLPAPSYHQLIDWVFDDFNLNLRADIKATDWLEFWYNHLKDSPLKGEFIHRLKNWLERQNIYLYVEPFTLIKKYTDVERESNVFRFTTIEATDIFTDDKIYQDTHAECEHAAIIEVFKLLKERK